MDRRHAISPHRTAELSALLRQQRRALTDDLDHTLQTMRSGGADDSDTSDEQEPEASAQEDIDLALIQMKAETLDRISAALSRLEQGLYGNCVACGHEISHRRLSALPFAARCKACEESREHDRPMRVAAVPRLG